MTATQEETTRYTVVSSTYSAIKSVLTLSKDYKLVSTVTNLAEKVGESVVGATGKYTGVNDLTELDSVVVPRLSSIDSTASPYLVKANNAVDNLLEDERTGKVFTFVNNYVVDEKKVVAAREAVRAAVVKNLEVVERNMKITNPETTVEVAE